MRWSYIEAIRLEDRQRRLYKSVGVRRRAHEIGKYVLRRGVLETDEKGVAEQKAGYIERPSSNGEEDFQRRIARFKRRRALPQCRVARAHLDERERGRDERKGKVDVREGLDGDALGCVGHTHTAKLS